MNIESLIVFVGIVLHSRVLIPRVFWLHVTLALTDESTSPDMRRHSPIFSFSVLTTTHGPMVNVVATRLTKGSLFHHVMFLKRSSLAYPWT